jgi:hypothetical protein
MSETTTASGGSVVSSFTVTMSTIIVADKSLTSDLCTMAPPVTSKHQRTLIGIGFEDTRKQVSDGQLNQSLAMA